MQPELFKLGLMLAAMSLAKNPPLPCLLNVYSWCFLVLLQINILKTLPQFQLSFLITPCVVHFKRISQIKWLIDLYLLKEHQEIIVHLLSYKWFKAFHKKQNDKFSSGKTKKKKKKERVEGITMDSIRIR